MRAATSSPRRPARTVRAALGLALACLAMLAPLSVRADEQPTYAVVLRQARIEPAVLEVPAGKRIKLTLRNEGPGPCEFENLALRVEKVLAPGASSFVVLPALRPGDYVFVDEFHPDTATLRVIAR